MWKLLRNYIENKKLLELEGKLIQLQTEVSGLRLDLFESLDTSLKNLTKRLGVRLSKLKKKEGEEEFEETETTKYNDGFDELRKLNKENDSSTSIRPSSIFP